MADLLVELRTEEIPAGYLDRALDALRDELKRGLEEAHLEYESVGRLGTPRRMVVHARGVAERQPDRHETAVGPAEKAAFDGEGNPTRAAEGFAKSQGVTVEQLEVRETKKGRYVAVDRTVAGVEAASLLPAILTEAVRRTPFPKRMRWAERDFLFARPIRGILALFGNLVLDWTLNGVTAGDETHGHRFLAPDPIKMMSADLEVYKNALQRACVMVDPDERREAVAAGLAAAAECAGGGFRDDGLVAEVTHMVEYPGVLTATFEERFLALPQVVIEAVLRNHQRYFSITGEEDGRMTNRFLSVVDRTDEMFDRVRDGNERVIRARLVDAEFFLAEDAKVPLAARAPALEKVIFLKGLGTIGDRVKRLGSLARNLGMVLYGTETAARAETAAALSKCDLVTAMVGEFPELQGRMGEIYARRLDGVDDEIAGAVREHYLPRGADDVVPETPTGTVLALADRLDLLVGCFLKGLEPTGSRDPYGLRRAALGVIRILDQGRQRLDLTKWLEKAAEGYKGLLPEADTPEGPLASLTRYLRERVHAHFTDRGMSHDLVSAAVATSWGDLLDLEARLEALHEMRRDPRFPALVELVERTHNIAKGLERERLVSRSLLAEPIEHEVFEALQELEGPLSASFGAGDFVAGSWAYLDGLGALMGRYFDEVFVNVDDDEVRNNRWSMLRAIHRLYRDHVADLSRVPRAAAEEA